MQNLKMTVPLNSEEKIDYYNIKIAEYENNRERKYTYNAHRKRKEQEIPSTLAECHYTNTPMQYTAIFHGCKIDNFQIKKL